MATKLACCLPKLCAVTRDLGNAVTRDLYSSANKHTNRRSVSIESLFSKMLVKKAPRFRNGILNCGEFFRPTGNNLLPSTFPSDRAQFW